MVPADREPPILSCFHPSRCSWPGGGQGGSPLGKCLLLEIHGRRQTQRLPLGGLPLRPWRWKLAVRRASAGPSTFPLTEGAIQRLPPPASCLVSSAAGPCLPVLTIYHLTFQQLVRTLGKAAKGNQCDHAGRRALFLGHILPSSLPPAPTSFLFPSSLPLPCALLGLSFWQ